MNRISIKCIQLSVFLFWGTWGLCAQTDTTSSMQRYDIKMSLDDVINTAHDQSPSAILAKHNFLVNYWEYRTYKAQFLPALNLSANLGQYNRSLTPVQSSETGEINYVDNNNLRNTLSLSIDQNIPFTGGTISVITSLSRLDQYSPENVLTYNSQPVNVYYTQPIRAYNSLKWQKKIEPKRYELAKREYLESMESISVYAATYFFDLLIAQEKLKIARISQKNTEQLYNIAQERFKIGSITRDEVLQLKQRLLSDNLAIQDNQLSEMMAMIKLRTFLGYNENVNIVLTVPPQNSGLSLNIEDVMMRVNENSSYLLSNEINKLSAEQEVARSKANSGLKASLYAQFGLNQVAHDLGGAYQSPLDQEVLGLSVSLPIIDWGLGRGGVKVAKSKSQVVEIQTQQTINSMRENVILKVLQFNIQGGQCEVSAEADEVGRSRYQSTKERFMNGSIGVLELNNAQTEMDNASIRYLQDLSNYWIYYYNIRRLTLYDYLTGEKIDEDFGELSGEHKE